MTCVNELFDCLNKLAPVGLKMDFDNVGILVGDKAQPVNQCLIALDITDEVIEEAVGMGADLIVSHHPLIFTPLKSILSDDLTGKKVLKLIKNGISAICMHTNLDIAEGGVNDALMAALGAEAKGILEPCGTDAWGNAVGCGRIGELPQETELSDFLIKCKETLNSAGLRYVDAGKPVHRLAVMGGSGGDCVSLVKELGCDTYVTADIKYNQFLDAKELGINLIDADHFCTENVVVPVLYEKLTAAFPEIRFEISGIHRQTVKFI